jgi:hypothetical protein
MIGWALSLPTTDGNLRRAARAIRLLAWLKVTS